MGPNRPDFLATMTLEEKAVMGQHLAYTRQLFDQGKIFLGGASTDGAIGIIVWRMDSAEEMQRIYENDPAVEAGIGYPEVHCTLKEDLMKGKTLCLGPS